MNNPKKYSQFRTKVLKILLFTGIVPLLIIAFVSLFTVVKTRLENISELQAQALSATSERIERYLDQKANVFNLVIDLNPDNISEIAFDRLEFIAQGLKDAAGNVNQLCFVDKYGLEIVKMSGKENDESAALENVSKNQGFQAAISGTNYFSPVKYFPSGPIIEMASQIENKNRNVIGVILAEINLEPITAEVSQVKLGREGFVYLIDGNGNLIVSSNANFASTGENLSSIDLIKDTMAGNAHNGLSEKDRYSNRLGQKVIFSGRPLDAIDWFIVSEWPWGDAFSIVQIMIVRFFGIILATLILIVALSLVFARLVVKPVETLSRGADEIAKGNFDYVIDIKTGDELEKLGERFKKMITVLKENKELRNQFVFIAAHELRAPVTVIKGYLSMILEGDLGEISQEMREALKISRELNDRLVQLVHDLLEVARSESGKIKIEVKPTSVQKIVRPILEEFEKLAKEKEIKLIYEKPKREIKVLVDSYRLKEVISNLVDNAVRYTPKGKGDIIISHKIEESNLVTHVKDSGIGMAKKDMGQLFTKFYRIKTKETREIPGTGLGLFICKELVKRMGGDIWASSQLGRGSTFSFSLPLV
jgi:signal transduction histidine kinase